MTQYDESSRAWAMRDGMATKAIAAIRATNDPADGSFLLGLISLAADAGETQRALSWAQAAFVSTEAWLANAAAVTE